MKPCISSTPLVLAASVLIAFTVFQQAPAHGAAATMLFEDHFTGGIPGWTAIQPTPATYIEGPMVWVYDKVTDSFSEQSNIYTDGAGFSPSRIAVMLINDTVAPANFTYTARLTAGDDDGFGLIFGYQNEFTFYRVSFARQNDANRNANWPFTGWCVDRMNDRQITTLFSDLPANPPQWVNIAGQPFNVTITVNNNKLTLTLVNDPDGAPVTYNLVTDGTLPGATGGKVGLFSWGMSAGNPRAFRIQNPVLTPTPLAGNPAATVLTNWSFLIPPRADGTTNMNSTAAPTWGQAMSVGGDRGTMIENSDTFLTADNNAAGTTNFAAPSAVAGDVNWSNYIYTARITSADDDGFGLLFRYKDETNFYRIGFRAQNSTSGVKRGISIQKNVDLNFDQIFASTAFIPPIDAPIDVHAAITGQRLQVMVLTNVTAAKPGGILFGPFDITGPTVDKGKIGVFSWAQFQPPAAAGNREFGTEVDFVKVQQVEGLGLLVSSAYGTPSPAVGLNDFPADSAINASVDDSVISEPGVRRVADGWVGLGSVPASGSGNQVNFNLQSLSSISWQWKTEYQLSVTAGAGGTVDQPGTQFIAAGSNVTVTATPNAGSMFVGWSGGSASQNPTLNFAMTKPITLTATFTADSDGDGLPDSWEQTYFGTLAQTALGDADSDGRDNLSEYLAGSNPVVAETVNFTDGLFSQWINEARDRAIPGRFVVTNLGSGYRGLWETSNQNRYADDDGFIGYPFITATNFATNASFQGPVIVAKTNDWNPAWAQEFSLSAEFTVGDDDGSCLYFRYLNESNWYRVTIDGQYQNAGSPLLGVSVQKRTNGYFEAMAFESYNGVLVYTDPLDWSGFKKVRLTVNMTNDAFEVRAIGYDTRAFPPDWNPGFETVMTFRDSGVPTGRIGVGHWGMGAFGGWNETNGLPVGSGFFADNIVLQVHGTNAFVENWETHREGTNFPAGWENPYANDVGLVGEWRVTGHGTIGNLSSAYGTLQTGTAINPKGDVEGPMLIGPPTTNANYLLEIGIHPLDDGAMGVVYDYVDTNNFARVLFSSQVPAAGQLPQGLTISRKTNGAWSDILIGDTSFIYTPGRAFEVRFANNNGAYSMTAWNTDAPGTVMRWKWTDQASVAGRRFGPAVWNMPDAHFTYIRALELPAPPEQFRISRVSIVGNNLVLDIEKPAGKSYTVQRATTVNGTYDSVAPNQTAAQYSEPLPTGPAFYRLLLQP